MKPEIGEIRRGWDIGKASDNKHIWQACPTCGKERWVPMRDGVPIYKCCNLCALRKPRRGEIIKCGTCGKEFYVQPCYINKKKYCSRECAYKAKMKGEPLICEVCGKEYYRSPSQVKLRGTKYCSKKCHGIAQSISQKGADNPSWRGGVSTENHCLRNSKQWKVWRDAVFARDNWTCQECGARSSKGNKVKLHPHHIKPFAYYPELRFEVSNGITLCYDCHKKHMEWKILRDQKNESKKSNGG